MKIVNQMKENKTKGFVKDYTGKIKKACPPPPIKKPNPVVEDSEDINFKDGKIKITLRTKTGYSCTIEGMISAKQWGEICKIINC